MGVPLSAVAAMMQSSPPAAAPTAGPRRSLGDSRYRVQITAPPGATMLAWSIGLYFAPNIPSRWADVGADGAMDIDIPAAAWVPRRDGSGTSYRPYVSVRAWGATAARRLGPSVRA